AIINIVCRVTLRVAGMKQVAVAGVREAGDTSQWIGGADWPVQIVPVIDGAVPHWIDRGDHAADHVRDVFRLSSERVSNARKIWPVIAKRSHPPQWVGGGEQSALVIEAERRGVAQWI